NKGMNMKQTLVVVAPQNVRPTDADNLNYMTKDSVFQNELSHLPQIQSVTSSSSIPGENIGYIMGYTHRSPDGGEKNLRLSTLEVGSRYLNQFNVQVVAGQAFAANPWAGKNPPMLLNEAAVTSLGFKNPEDAIVKLVETKNGRGRVFQNEVIGVVKNFHQVSLKDDYTPIVFRPSDPNSTSRYELKVNTNNLPHTIAQVEKTFKSVYPESAFQYFFLDE